VKSVIDWNELVPRLPKKVRDDLYLEAVAILSQQDEGTPQPKNKPRSPDVRSWRKQKIPGDLNMPGRIFRINKGLDKKIDETAQFGRVWALLKESRTDTISVEGINSISKGIGVPRLSDVVWYLWARGFIDVEVKK